MLFWHRFDWRRLFVKEIGTWRQWSLDNNLKLVEIDGRQTALHTFVEESGVASKAATNDSSILNPIIVCNLRQAKIRCCCTLAQDSKSLINWKYPWPNTRYFNPYVAILRNERHFQSIRSSFKSQNRYLPLESDFRIFCGFSLYSPLSSVRNICSKMG